jgi:cysteinyl-tRNA synthetase
VRYFIHVGHLHIKGCKMSKSLKNFITIKTLTQIVQPRVIRLFFVMHRYDAILDYDPDTSLK